MPAHKNSPSRRHVATCPCCGHEHDELTKAQATKLEGKWAKEIARLASTPPSHAEAIDLLRWVSRCAKMPAPHGIACYAIADEIMSRICRAVGSAAPRATKD